LSLFVGIREEERIGKGTGRKKGKLFSLLSFSLNKSGKFSKPEFKN
jgi:hypothetical protein